MAASAHGCHRDHTDGQPTSSRLGLGLTASAPHHQPRGHLHPRDRERLYFDSADDLFVPGIPVDFMVAQGVRAFARAAYMPAHGRSFARVAAPGVVQAFLDLLDARAAGWEAAEGRGASRSDARTCSACREHGSAGEIGRNFEFGVLPGEGCLRVIHVSRSWTCGSFFSKMKPTTPT